MASSWWGAWPRWRRVQPEEPATPTGLVDPWTEDPTRYLTGRTVLVLAGNEIVIDSVREALDPHGVQVGVVSSVDEAAARLTQAAPDVLLFHDSVPGAPYPQAFRSLWSAAGPFDFPTMWIVDDRQDPIFDLGGFDRWIYRRHIVTQLACSVAYIFWHIELDEAVPDSDDIVLEQEGPDRDDTAPKANPDA